MTQVTLIDSYAKLCTAIADALNRDDLADTIQLWPQLLESRINYTLRHHKMVIKAYAAGLAGDPAIAIPLDWLEARTIEVNGRGLKYKSQSELNDIRIQYENRTEPLDTMYFSFYDKAIEIWPTPGADFTITMDYYQKIPSLAAQASGTNWLLQDAPDLYLYGSLVHSAPYLRDDQRIEVWRSFADEALVLLDTASNNAMHRGSAMVRRGPRAF